MSDHKYFIQSGTGHVYKVLFVLSSGELVVNAVGNNFKCSGVVANRYQWNKALEEKSLKPISEEQYKCIEGLANGS